MPTKTKRDEEKWDKAKGIAEKAGQKDNYAYIMGIYKKMKPDYEFKTGPDAKKAKMDPADELAIRFLLAEDVVEHEGQAKQAAGKYDHINFKPPESVANAAKKGLEYRQKTSPSNRGGLTPSEASKEGIGSGVSRATSLKNRSNISPKVIGQMVGFFSRHEKNKGVDAEHKNEPWNDKGHVAWLLWGGDPGKAWAEKVKAQMDAADRKKTARGRWQDFRGGALYRQDGFLVTLNQEYDTRQHRMRPDDLYKWTQKNMPDVLRDPEGEEWAALQEELHDRGYITEMVPVVDVEVLRQADQKHHSGKLPGTLAEAKQYVERKLMPLLIRGQRPRWLSRAAASKTAGHPEDFEEWWEYLPPGGQRRVLRELGIRKSRGWDADEWEKLIDYYVRTHVGDPRGWYRVRNIAARAKTAGHPKFEQFVQELKGIRDALPEVDTDMRYRMATDRIAVYVEGGVRLGLLPKSAKSSFNRHARGPGALGLDTSRDEGLASWQKFIDKLIKSAERKNRQHKTAKSNTKVVEVPNTFHPVKLEPPKAKRSEGYIDFQGIQIDVENAKGSTRRGEDADGNPWETYMFAHYGEIRGTEGVDGDMLDVYVGDNHDSSIVVVIHQYNPWDGKYDEDKVVIGCESVEEAIGLYKKQYNKPGFYREGEYTVMPIGAFWRWVKDTRNKGKKVKVAKGSKVGIRTEVVFERSDLRVFMRAVQRAIPGVTKVAPFGSPLPGSEISMTIHPSVSLKEMYKVKAALEKEWGIDLSLAASGDRPERTPFGGPRLFQKRPEDNYTVMTLRTISHTGRYASLWKKGYAEGKPGAVNAAKTMLSNLLAYLRALQWNYLTAHWQIGGDSSYGDHLLFQRMYEGMGDEIDTLAEKLVGLFGIGAVDPMEQSKVMAFTLHQWDIGCPFERSLKAEQGLQAHFKKCKDALEDLGQLTLGMDDYLAATASAHETNIYLIQQRQGGVKMANMLSPLGREKRQVRRVAARALIKWAAARGRVEKPLTPREEKLMEKVNMWVMDVEMDGGGLPRRIEQLSNLRRPLTPSESREMIEFFEFSAPGNY